MTGKFVGQFDPDYVAGVLSDILSRKYGREIIFTFTPKTEEERNAQNRGETNEHS